MPVGKTKLAPVFYFDTGKGFSETQSVRLRADKNGIEDWIFVPRQTRTIRFDPMAAAGEFRINYVIMKAEPFAKGVRKNIQQILALYPTNKPTFKALSREALAVLKEESLAGAWDRFLAAGRPSDPPASYNAWIETVEAAEGLTGERMRAEIARFAFTPLISIVMPVYNTPRRWLEEAIRSIKAQAYENWELCLCDDNSSEGHIWPMLQKYAAEDARIKLHRRSENGRISLASNDAMALATGAYMTLMDHDDVIPANALYEFVKVLNRDRTVDFIYSDEDKLSIAGVRYEPFFKPDWSPETLEACMYTAHLALYRMDIVERVGGFRNECNGAQDYDFVLRYTEHVRNVVHVPKVLYHWRAIPGSTAQRMDNKDYVIGAALRALSDRAGRTGEVDFARPGAYAGCFELRRRLTATPLVSIVIPSAGRDSEIGGRQVDLLAECIASIHETSTYKNIEIVVVDNGTCGRRPRPPSTVSAPAASPTGIRCSTSRRR